MRPVTLVAFATVSLSSIIGLSDGIGVFSLAAGNPASLLIGLPFTVTGVSSGTLAALGALKLLAATALALSYTGSGSSSPPASAPAAPSYGSGSYGSPSYGGNNYGTEGYNNNQGYSSVSNYGSNSGIYDNSYGSGNSYSSGNSYASNSYAPSSGSYGSSGIYKRSVDNQIGNMDLYFHIINEVDSNSCALRLICELESIKEKNKLQEDERMILALFGPKPKEVPLSALKTPSGPYHFAAYLGSTSTPTECGKFYSKCPYSGSQMMTALRSASQQ